MIVIKPTAIADASFVSSTVPETDYAAWSAATTYAIGDRVILGTGYHSVYESLRATNLNHHPATDTSSPAYWARVGPTNRWAMFDTRNATITSAAGSVSAVFTPGQIGAMFLSGLVGSTATVQIKDGVAGAVVYSATVSLLTGDVFDWFSYFFANFDQKAQVVLTDLPIYSSSYVTVTVTGSGTVEIGTLLVGKMFSEGSAQYGAEAGIVDYSRKEVDAFGVMTFVERAFSKRFSVSLAIDKARTIPFISLLNSLRATPAVYITTSDDNYAYLAALGFYRSYRTVVSYPTQNLISLEIEELA